MTETFADRGGYIWLDGELVEWRDARIHVLTHGLHYASAVFEGSRVYGGVVFKKREHTERLLASGRMLGFEIPYTAEELDAATTTVLRVNDVTEGYVRPIAWRGPEQLSISAPNSSIRVAIAAWALGGYFSAEAAARGLSLVISDWRRPSPASAPVHAKAAGLYTICTLAKHTALAAGFDDALMLDWRGYVAETTAANIFFVINGELHTPKPDCFLNGITRQTVLTIARDLGITTVERFIPEAEISQATEVFITGTAAEVTAVGRVGAIEFGDRVLTRQLQRAYSAHVRTAPSSRKEI